MLQKSYEQLLVDFGDEFLRENGIEAPTNSVNKVLSHRRGVSSVREFYENLLGVKVQKTAEGGYIEQNVFLFNTTIRENITLGEDFSEEQLHAAIQGSALAADLAAMPDGLDTVVGEDGSNLSGGQKQRVAIARALIHNRSILLVDEGTSALDQKNADLVEKSLLTNPDLTLILISHHLSAARRAQFDRVYELAPVTQ